MFKAVIAGALAVLLLAPQGNEADQGLACPDETPDDGIFDTTPYFLIEDQCFRVRYQLNQASSFFFH